MLKRPQGVSQRAFLLAMLLLGGSLPTAACVPQGSISRWLEDQTGHTELTSQLKGLVRLALQPSVATQDLVPVSHTGVYPLGASTFFEQEVEERKLRQSMEMLRAAGVRWVRQEFPWDRIEWEGKGRYLGPYGSTWESYDRIVALAEEYGLEIVARPDLPPYWSKRNNSVPRAPPDNYADYGDFIATLVERYKGRIRYYQIWNEPNTYLEWGKTPEPAEYVELLKIAHQRAKAIDPEVVVLSAALAPTLGTPDGLNVSDLDYLEEMYAAGAIDYFDILSAQGYGLWTGPGDRRAEPGQVNMSRVQLLRAIMVRHGDQHKAVWVSEFGWDAVPLDFPKPALHGRVTEEQQARYTRDGLLRIQEEWPWVGVVFYWYFRKVSDDARQHEDFYFRLVDPDFTPRPVYYALQHVAEAPPALRYGWHQEDHWAITYSSGWQQRRRGQEPPGYPDSFRLTGLPGRSLSFAFKGSDLTLVTARGPGAGRLEVMINGAPHPTDAAGVLDLQDLELEWDVRVPLALGLKDVLHTVTLTTAGEGEVVIDGFIVTTRHALLPQQVAGAVLLLGCGLALVLGVIARHGRRG